MKAISKVKSYHRETAVDWLTMLVVLKPDSFNNLDFNPECELKEFSAKQLQLVNRLMSAAYSAGATNCKSKRGSV